MQRAVPLVAVPLAICATLAAGAGLAACGTPPELRPQPGSSVPQPPSLEASPSTQPAPQTGVVLPPGETATASPQPSFPEGFAVACNGYPTADQVISLVRRTGGLLPRTGTVTASTGPLCAGSWQYTVLTVARQEPLLVVSRGTPRSLTLVTAGTDVCSIQVRTSAPVGIRTAALCPEPGT